MQALRTNPEPTRLVTLPMIVANGHDWYMYFAVDHIDSIDVNGCMTIGSTRDLREAYKLVASLAAVKSWVEDDFYKAMKAWFNVSEEV
jgi:hypothetical protein